MREAAIIGLGRVSKRPAWVLPRLRQAEQKDPDLRVCQAAVHYTHWPTLVLGALAFGIMYGLKKVAPKVPNVLVAVVVTTLISWGMGFQHNEYASLSAIQSGELRGWVHDFNKAVIEIPEIQSCMLIAGQFDYVLKVRSRDIAHFREILGDSIGKLPGVRQSNSFAVMEIVKETEYIQVLQIEP